MLTRDDLQLPGRDGEWGWFNLGHSAPSTGGAWNETGARRERRHLKHRAVEEVRPVPISPALARPLRGHLAEYDTAPDGRLFRGEAGDLLSDTVCTRTWEKARQAALTKAEAASPLAERPYDLRHARLSTWAQRRRRSSPSRRMGGQQRPRPPPHLRQMPHRLRADGAQAHRTSRSGAREGSAS